MMKYNIILASASPRRKELLDQIGIQATVIPCDLEEEVTSDVPGQVVEELSRQKADHIFNLHCRQKTDDEIKSAEDACSDTIVIGSDTVVAVKGKILGKPHTQEEAEEMIGMIQGEAHEVYTGVTLTGRKKSVTFSEKTDVYVYPMTEGEIKEYVSCGESMDKAGAYGIQGRFAAFIERLEGSYTNVMGLPAGRVYQELKKFPEDSND